MKTQKSDLENIFSLLKFTINKKKNNSCTLCTHTHTILKYILELCSSVIVEDIKKNFIIFYENI